MKHLLIVHHSKTGNTTNLARAVHAGATDPAVAGVEVRWLTAARAGPADLYWANGLLLGTPENFGAMVKQGYPMVYRPAEVQMLELRNVAGNLWQRVRITDQAGAGWFLDYMMVETAEGWQINAVQILPAPDVGV